MPRYHKAETAGQVGSGFVPTVCLTSPEGGHEPRRNVGSKVVALDGQGQAVRQKESCARNKEAALSSSSLEAYIPI